MLTASFVSISVLLANFVSVYAVLKIISWLSKSEVEEETFCYYVVDIDSEYYEQEFNI